MRKIYYVLIGGIFITGSVYAEQLAKIYNPRQVAEWAVKDVDNTDSFYIPILNKKMDLHVDSKYRDCVRNEIMGNIVTEYSQIKEADLDSIKYKAQQGKCGNYVEASVEETYDVIYDLCMTGKFPAMQELIYNIYNKDNYSNDKDDFVRLLKELPKMDVGAGWCNSYAQTFVHDSRDLRIYNEFRDASFYPNVSDWYEHNELTLYAVNIWAEGLYKMRVLMAGLKPDYKYVQNCKNMYTDNIDAFIAKAEKPSTDDNEYGKAYLMATNNYKMAVFNIADKIRCEPDIQERYRLGKIAADVFMKWAKVLRVEASVQDKEEKQENETDLKEKQALKYYTFYTQGDILRKEAQEKENTAKEILFLLDNLRSSDKEIQ